ncbi:hypothetical protein HRbin24_01759 [bacterium HR24]|nr:hypothetical protein HRbin24_01759 [bacterium HR24]
MTGFDAELERALADLAARRLAAYRAGDATGILMADHDWLRPALAELRSRARDGADASVLQRLAGAVWEVVDGHSRVEEEVYFPAVDRLLAEAGRPNPMVMAMAAEHDALPDRHRRLVEALAAGKDPLPAIDAFSRALLIHFDNEEDLVFEDAREALQGEEGRRLAQAMAAFLGIGEQQGG